MDVKVEEKPWSVPGFSSGFSSVPLFFVPFFTFSFLDILQGFDPYPWM